MPSRNETMRARERLQSATPIYDDESLLKLEEDVAKYLREAKRRDALQPDELVSTVLMPSRMTIFGTSSENKRA